MPLTIAVRNFPDADFDPPSTETEPQLAVFAGGCFWCVEAVYREIKGVISVTSGYAGGTEQTAQYSAVCSGRTNHAEVVQIYFDPRIASFGKLLKVFFTVAHDPTQIDRQGNDIGRQYRSAIFYRDAMQREIADKYIRQINQAGVFTDPIATTLEPFSAFFEAEAYHQDYARQNPGQPYIRGVAMPKLEKLRTYFGEWLKTSSS